jgi:hypothetical protein
MQRKNNLAEKWENPEDYEFDPEEQAPNKSHETEEAPSKEIDIEKQEFSEQTVAEFIIELEEIRNKTENEKLKSQLTFQIAKIQLGLMAAELKLDEVRVCPLERGVLGVFNTGNQEISISRELLLDFNTDSKLIELVGTHEGFHKGIYKFKPVADEGFTEEAAERKTGKKSRIYQEKKDASEKIWEEKGFDATLLNYDQNAPKRLAEFFLNAGIKSELNSEIKAYKKEKRPEKKDWLLKGIKIKAEKLSEKLEKKFKKGAERLHIKLKEAEKDNYFENTTKEIIIELTKK